MSSVSNILSSLGTITLPTLRSLLDTRNLSVTSGQAGSLLSTIFSRFRLSDFDPAHYNNIFRNLSGDRFRPLQSTQVRNIVDRIPTAQMDSLFNANTVNNLTAGQAGDILHSLLRRADLDTIPNGALSRLGSKLDNAKVGTLLRNLSNTQLTDLLTHHGQLARRLANRATLTPDQSTRLRRLNLRSGTVAGAVTDAVRSGGRVCNRNAALCAGAAAAGTYLAVDYAGTSEDFKECMAYCLPENWEEYKNDATTVLQYQTTTSIQAAYNGADFPTDLFQEQPYCTVDHVNENDDACEIHCRDQCEELHQSVLDQIGDTMGGLGETLETLLGGTLDFLSDPIGALKTVGIWIVCFIVGIVLLKLIFGLIMKLLFNRSKNNQTVTAQPIVVKLSDKTYSGFF